MVFNLEPIKVEIILDKDQFVKGLKDLEKKSTTSSKKIEKGFKSTKKGADDAGKSFASMGKLAKGALGAIAAVGVAAAAAGAKLLSMSKDALETTAAIADVSDKIGFGVESLQELRFAAETAGLGTNVLDTALQRFSRRVAEARLGTGEARGALQELGVALTDSAGLARRNEDVLRDVAEAFKNTGSESDRLRLAFKLFDTEGAGLVNILADGTAGLEEFSSEARELGAIIDEETVRSAQDMNAELTKLQSALNAQLTESLVALGPALLVIAESALQVANAISEVVEGFVDLDSLGIDALERQRQKAVEAQKAFEDYQESVENSFLLRNLKRISEFIPGPGEVGGEDIDEVEEERQRLAERIANIDAAIIAKREQLEKDAAEREKRRLEQREAEKRNIAARQELTRQRLAEKEEERQKKAAAREAQREEQRLKDQKERLKDLAISNDQQQRLIAATEEGVKAQKEMVTQIAIENALRAENLTLQDAAGMELAAQVKLQIQLDDELSKANKKLQVALNETSFLDDLGKNLDETISGSIKSGFRSSLESGDWNSFLTNLGNDILGTLVDSFLEAAIKGLGFDTLFQNLFSGDVAGAGGGGLIDKATGGLNALQGKLFGGGGEGGEAAAAPAEGIKDALGEGGEELSTGILGSLKAGGTKVLGFLDDGFGKGADLLGGAFEGFGSILSSIPSLLGGLFGGGGGAGGILSGLSGALGGIGGFLGFAEGGMVPALAGSSPFQDSVPALLTPGERVLTRDENKQLERGLLGRESNNFNVTINAVDSRSFEEMLTRNPRSIEKLFVNLLRSNSPMRDEIRRVR